MLRKNSGFPSEKFIINYSSPELRLEKNIWKSKLSSKAGKIDPLPPLH